MVLRRVRETRIPSALARGDVKLMSVWLKQYWIGVGIALGIAAKIRYGDNLLGD